MLPIPIRSSLSGIRRYRLWYRSYEVAAQCSIQNRVIRSYFKRWWICGLFLSIVESDFFFKSCAVCLNQIDGILLCTGWSQVIVFCVCVFLIGNAPVRSCTFWPKSDDWWERHYFHYIYTVMLRTLKNVSSTITSAIFFNHTERKIVSCCFG